MLLSGVLVGGQALANRAQIVDIPVGQGHVVSFAIRPYWRWQTQGTFFLGFNTILNWNDLDAGKATASGDDDAVNPWSVVRGPRPVSESFDATGEKGDA